MTVRKLFTENHALLKRLIVLTAYEKQIQMDAYMSYISMEDGSLSCLISGSVWALNICQSWLYHDSLGQSASVVAGIQ